MKKMSFLLVTVLMIMLFSCSTDKKEKPIHQSDYKTSAMKYMPLELGNKWKYQVNYFGSAGIVDIQITATDGEWFVDNKGAKLKCDKRGVRDEDRYILMFPLQREPWISIIDNKTRELRNTEGVDEAVAVPAGKFEGAVKVHTIVDLPEAKVLHTYHYFVSGVGIVKIQSMIEDVKEGKMIPQTLTELVEYTINGSKN